MADCEEQHLVKTERTFAGTGFHITLEEKRHLQAALGTRNFIVEYVQEKVKKWKAEIKRLSSMARPEPHAAYTTFTH